MNGHIDNSFTYASALEEIIEQAYASQTHYTHILETGDDALLARIYLIRNAKRSINIQTFIWADDESGSFVFAELVGAAERGVKVNILIDDLSIRKIPQMVAYLAARHPGIKIKQYNPLAENIETSTWDLVKGWGLKFGPSNQRMHNKIIIVDGHIGITGGRNFENDYFDRGKNRNFKDRDIMVIGPEVRAMTSSFEQYWNYELSIPSKEMKDVRQAIENQSVSTPEIASDYEIDPMFLALDLCLASQRCMDERLLDKFLTVDKLLFVADRPGKVEEIGAYKTSTTTNFLIELITSTKKSMVLQSPYLIIGRTGTKILKGVRKQNPDLETIVSTNSLAAADHFYAYAYSYRNKKKYLKTFNWQIYEFKPDPLEHRSLVPVLAGIERSEDYHACIHAKTYVFDDKTWIGSFNLDPRSGNLNTEAGVLIEDGRMASVVRDYILRDASPQNSWTIGKRKNVPLVSSFSRILESVFRLIPIANIWPFQYSTSFELRDGSDAVPFYSDDFYQNYKAVGDFPKAGMSSKAVKTRLVKAFFGPAEPIM